MYSDDKAGRDVGEICALGVLGVTATRDQEAILALDADCVVYAAQGELNPMGALDDICRLLASGKIAVHGEDENDQGRLGTAMHAVHAIGPVCAAPPGIRTFLDLPMVAGRHALRHPLSG